MEQRLKYVRCPDITGRVFRYLTVLCFLDHGSKRDHRSFWLCRCRCGMATRVSGADLRTGKVNSCGCRLRETRYRTHGHGHHGNRTYISYTSAKGRCRNRRDPSYSHYGGRGIKFKFTSFEEFLRELGERPLGKTLDRFPNNDGHYEPGNVRWATPKQQAENRKRAA